MLLHEAEQAAHSIAQGQGQPRNAARADEALRQNSRPLSFCTRLLLAASHFPQSLVNALWLNWQPVVLVYVSISRYTGSHMA